MEMEVGFWNNFAGSTSRRVVARAADVISVLTLVAGGLGVSVLPAHVSRAAIPGVVFRKMIGGRRKADYAAVHRKNEEAPLIRLFVQFLKENFPAEHKKRNILDQKSVSKARGKLGF
jgi:DNA-binding transcriptional LysR family regulator